MFSVHKFVGKFVLVFMIFLQTRYSELKIHEVCFGLFSENFESEEEFNNAHKDWRAFRAEQSKSVSSHKVD